MADGREERETIDGRCVNRFSRPGFSRPGWVHFWGLLRCGSVSPSPPVGLLVCLWGQSPKLARFTFKLFYNSPSIAPLHFWIWKAKGQGFKDAKNGKMAESLLVVTAPQMLRHTSSKDQNVPIPGRVCPSIHSSIHPFLRSFICKAHYVENAAVPWYVTMKDLLKLLVYVICQSYRKIKISPFFGPQCTFFNKRFHIIYVIHKIQIYTAT